MARPGGPGRVLTGPSTRPTPARLRGRRLYLAGERPVNGRRPAVDNVQILITGAAVGSVVVAWRAGHLVGAGVLCILVTFIVLLQRVDVL